MCAIEIGRVDLDPFNEKILETVSPGQTSKEFRLHDSNFESFSIRASCNKEDSGGEIEITITQEISIHQFLHQSNGFQSLSIEGKTELPIEANGQILIATNELIDDSNVYFVKHNKTP